jgi:hypothetical protein
MDTTRDIMAQVEVYMVTGTSCHRSILPPFGRTLYPRILPRIYQIFHL